MAQGTWETAISSEAERPHNLVKYYTPGELISKWADITVSDTDWNPIEVVEQAAIAPSNPQDQGVAYELELQEGRKRHYSIGCADPVQGDIIVARFYLPDTPDIRDNTVWLTAKANP